VLLVNVLMGDLLLTICGFCIDLVKICGLKKTNFGNPFLKIQINGLVIIIGWIFIGILKGSALLPLELGGNKLGGVNFNYSYGKVGKFPFLT